MGRVGRRAGVEWRTFPRLHKALAPATPHLKLGLNSGAPPVMSSVVTLPAPGPSSSCTHRSATSRLIASVRLQGQGPGGWGRVRLGNDIDGRAGGGSSSTVQHCQITGRALPFPALLHPTNTPLLKRLCQCRPDTRLGDASTWQCLQAWLQKRPMLI